MALLGCHLEREPLRAALRIFPMCFGVLALLCYSVWVFDSSGVARRVVRLGPAGLQGSVHSLPETAPEVIQPIIQKAA